jgi:hypothetical protein
LGKGGSDGVQGCYYLPTTEYYCKRLLLVSVVGMELSVAVHKCIEGGECPFLICFELDVAVGATSGRGGRGLCSCMRYLARHLYVWFFCLVITTSILGPMTVVATACMAARSSLSLERASCKRPCSSKQSSIRPRRSMLAPRKHIAKVRRCFWPRIAPDRPYCG